MAETPKTHYWRGTVQTEAHALKVVNYTAGTFGILTAMGVVSLFNPPVPDLSKLIVVLLIGIPSVSMIRTKSLWAARTLLGFCLFCLVGCTFIGVAFAFNATNRRLAWVLLSISALWLLLTFASMRACEGAKWLRNHRRAALSEATVA
jgi:hypothetical protein